MTFEDFKNEIERLRKYHRDTIKSLSLGKFIKSTYLGGESNSPSSPDDEYDDLNIFINTGVILQMCACWEGYLSDFKKSYPAELIENCVGCKTCKTEREVKRKYSDTTPQIERLYYIRNCLSHPNTEKWYKKIGIQFGSKIGLTLIGDQQIYFFMDWLLYHSERLHPLNKR